MNRRRALPAFFLACLLTSPVFPPGEARAGSEPVRYAAYGEVPEVTGIETFCPSCWGKNGSHKSDCPYAGGGGSSGDSDGERTPTDFTHVPLFVAPVGLVGGIFMGAGWLFSEMAGKYPGVNILDSYHNFMSIKSDDKQFSDPFNAGLHTGGMPWLIVGVVTLPIRAGVVALANLASRPSPPKPRDPNVAVYVAIAKSYSGYRDEAKVELHKASGDVRAAELRREKFLDEFILDRPDLLKIRDTEGLEAARAKAAIKLDAWSRSRDEKAKLAAVVSRDIRETDAFCQAALGKANTTSSIIDIGFERKTKQLEQMKNDLSRPQEIRDSCARDHKLMAGLSKFKSYSGIAGDLTSLAESGSQARSEGKNLAEWVGEPGTKEAIVRLNIHLLTLPKKLGFAGTPVGVAESVLDGAYAVSVNIYYADQLEKERTLLEKLATARVFDDVMGDDWKRINIPIEAAKVREKTIGEKVDRYARLVTENEAHANKLR